MIKVFLFGFFLALLFLDSPGKLLQLKKQFGEDELILPGQIIASRDEIFILDEYADMTSGDEKIKIFSRDGKFKMEFGRGGQGPGEYGEARAIYILNNKIYILDAMMRKVHIFSQKEKKFLESKKVWLGAPKQPFTTPGEFLIAPDGAIYYNASRAVKGEKLITKLIEIPGNEFRVEKGLLDCVPFYNSRREMMKKSVQEENTPDSVRKSYINDGYIAFSNNKIYFTHWLLNIVYELSTGGEILAKYILPVKSIDKTVNVVKMTRFSVIERRLNYDLLSRNGRIYVLSRGENKDSIVFQLEEGNFVEKYRMKEQLFSFDISGNRLYGIDNEKCLVYLYHLE
jgi:hypothetical protein